MGDAIDRPLPPAVTYSTAYLGRCELAVRLARERLQQHRDNLALWQSGYLDPTEPDPEERKRTVAELRVAITVLETLLREAGVDQ